MIIYNNTKRGFLNDIPHIEDILTSSVRTKLGEETSEGEIRSWHNSLRYMARVVDSQAIPDDTGVALEYNIPVTNNRIDFIITGLDSKGISNIVMIELKQWQHVQATDKDGLVVTHYEDGLKETTHPSYQVACYASLLYDFNEAVHQRKVSLHPCVFMHNYVDDGSISDERYRKYTEKAPVFCKDEEDKLREFITRYVRKSDQNKSIYVIENGKKVPSKSLIDCVVKMAQGNPEFKMIDEQKVAYQNILWAYDEYQRTGRKQVVIVKGGPGTGKSVIAVKLLVEMTRRKLLAHYVTKNKAPRAVFYKQFIGVKGVDSSFKSLFKSCYGYDKSKENEFDMLIVAEAHRLPKTIDYFGKIPGSIIRGIICASKVSVFFIDEKQIVDLRDAGTIADIERIGHESNADVHNFELNAQFRCSGSDEYLNWLNHLLQYDGLHPIKLSGTTYDFKLFDSPSELMAEIKKRNRWRNKSRVVAGFCWDWVSKDNPKVKDIVIGDDFAYQWNLSPDYTWCISKGAVDQIGCIHRCQGLELDYVGVIIGEDLVFCDRMIKVAPHKRSSDDRTIDGWAKLRKEKGEEGDAILRAIIKNTYRTLMTRGMKGCYVYVCDEKLRNYIKQWI